MINARIAENEKTVYVDVSGYISRAEASRFLNDYKIMTRGLRGSQYKLIVTPSVFECEDNSDIRTVCMTFLKTNYKRMYLIDPRNYIMNNLSLGKTEQKLFTKSVKIINSLNDAK